MNADVAHVTAKEDRGTIRFRAPRTDDGATLWELARSNGLDENSPYAYLLWSEYFVDTTVVAVDDDDHVIGFVMGFNPPREPTTAFVWQVGVDAAHRRRGIAGALLDQLVERTGADRLEATVTPSNTASKTLFTRFGDRHGAEVVIEELFTEDMFPPGHEAEERYRIGPITRPR